GEKKAHRLPHFRIPKRPRLALVEDVVIVDPCSGRNVSRIFAVSVIALEVGGLRVEGQISPGTPESRKMLVNETLNSLAQGCVGALVCRKHPRRAFYNDEKLLATQFRNGTCEPP